MSSLKLKLRNIFLNIYSDSKRPPYLQNSFKTQLSSNNTKLNPPAYINMRIPLIYKKSLTRIRLQSNRLGVITGRYTRPITPVQNRICRTCNELDDEKHLFWNCNITEQFRKDSHNELTAMFPDFDNLNHDEQLSRILNTESENETFWCGKFIHKMACIRNLV